jgi:hypothetical protein
MRLCSRNFAVIGVFCGTYIEVRANLAAIGEGMPSSVILNNNCFALPCRMSVLATRLRFSIHYDLLPTGPLWGNRGT